ncbi:MAG: trypsin-like peptidase domain-containing protein [Clostridia bacterium]|nr:trypsin-like peptidase domain-containing protein [Clostridia bacterium]
MFKKTPLVRTAALLAAAMLLASPVCAEENVGVIVNGQEISNGLLIDGSVYVPLRAVGESLGCEVSWNDETRTASVMQLSDETRVVNAIAKAGESVVAIVGTVTTSYMSREAQDYNENHAHGSGVVIKSNGTILTNNHVVEDMQDITVIFGSGESYAASVLYSDSEADLAVIKINKLGLTPITFAAEDSLSVGQTVIAIGAPPSISSMNTASRGIVSGIGININEHYLYNQSDVAINGGNSGGPLINLDGEMVGINAIKYVGSTVEGMSFSIPVDTINYVLKNFEAYGKVLRPETGITMSESWESKEGLPTTKGLTVTSSQSSALSAGDVVTCVNGVAVHSIADYNEAIKKTYTGGDLVFTYTRGGVSSEVVITPTNQ